MGSASCIFSEIIFSKITIGRFWEILRTYLRKNKNSNKVTQDRKTLISALA